MQQLINRILLITAATVLLAVGMVVAQQPTHASAVAKSSSSSSEPDCTTTNTDPKCSDPAIQPCNKSQCDLIALYLNPAIKVLSGLVGVVVVISIIVGGIQYSSSEGDPQKVAKAKSRLNYTILAFIAYLFLFAFLQFIIPGGIFNR